MQDVTNLRDTIIPKSDQMNADDLVSTVITTKVIGVSRGNEESPLIVHCENDGGRPFKPCKTMRKLLIVAWGENGNDWIGRSMTLYCDASVKYAGKSVGGIRISHLSHITKRVEVNLTATRGKKQLYTVNILQPTMYPDNLFNSTFKKMEEMVSGGKITITQIITKCSQTGTLTNEQLTRINSIKPYVSDGFKPAAIVEKIKDEVIEQPAITDEQIQNKF
tara:strand:+ start:686 stop:1345 length:660 start_codon:yes stop_codon:yes gene_type:complete